jgi:hypothetical protein
VDLRRGRVSRFRDECGRGLSEEVGFRVCCSVRKVDLRGRWLEGLGFRVEGESREGGFQGLGSSVKGESQRKVGNRYQVPGKVGERY